MEKRDDGGVAFPGKHTRAIQAFGTGLPYEETVNHQGMTMRQWYKGMALAGIRVEGITVEEMVIKCSLVADALIAEDKEATK